MSESSLSLQHSSGYGQIQGPAISSGIPALGYPIILFWSMKLQRNQRTMMKTMVNGTLQHGFWYFISDVLKEHQTMLAGRNSLGSSRKSFVARSAAREPPLWLPSCTTCPTSRSPVRVLWLRAGEDGKRCLSQSWTNEPKWKSWKLGKSPSYRWFFPFMAIWCREFQFPRLIRGSYPYPA